MFKVIYIQQCFARLLFNTETYVGRFLVSYLARLQKMTPTSVHSTEKKPNY